MNISEKDFEVFVKAFIESAKGMCAVQDEDSDDYDMTFDELNYKMSSKGMEHAKKLCRNFLKNVENKGIDINKLGVSFEELGEAFWPSYNGYGEGSGDFMDISAQFLNEDMAEKLCEIAESEEDYLVLDGDEITFESIS